MASKNTSNQTCENENDNQWPRFLIMEAADENVPLNLNAFVLKKAIDGMANAELDNVKPMKSGRVFIEVETRQQCKNLLKTTKLLGYLPVKVSPHRTLNSSKFVIKCEELDKMEEDEIKKELQPQGIIAVKRISIRYSLYVLTIKGQTVPKRINIGYLKKETRPYIPNPQRCFQCQKFGHTKNSCKGKAVCAGCGEEGHNLDDCKTNQNAWIVKVTMLLYQEIAQNGKWKKTLWPSSIQKRFHSQMLANVYNPLSTHQRIHMQLSHRPLLNLQDLFHHGPKKSDFQLTLGPRLSIWNIF